MDWNETFDVVVVGSGMAGLSTALSAHECGLRAVVLEKAAKLGGGTAFANGGIWIGDNHIARAAGYKDSRENVLRYMHFIAGDEAIEENLLAYVERGPEALKFFEDCGVRFRISKGLSDHYYDSAPGSVAEGRCLNTDYRRHGAWRMAGRHPGAARHPARRQQRGADRVGRDHQHRQLAEGDHGRSPAPQNSNPRRRRGDALRQAFVAAAGADPPRPSREAADRRGRAGCRH